MSEQPFTESEREVIEEVVNRRVQQEIAPAVDHAFDVGGVAALRSAAFGFSMVPQDIFTKAELMESLARMERAMDPSGTVGKMVDQMEETTR